MHDRAPQCSQTKTLTTTKPIENIYNFIACEHGYNTVTIRAISTCSLIPRSHTHPHFKHSHRALCEIKKRNLRRTQNLNERRVCLSFQNDTTGVATQSSSIVDIRALATLDTTGFQWFAFLSLLLAFTAYFACF